MASKYILADTSPLIHLAMIERLDLLVRVGQVVIPDMVLMESTAHKSDVAAVRISAWAIQQSLQGNVSVAETDVGKTYRLALKADPLHRMKNAGEIAIMDWLVDYVDRSDDHTIVIYENGKVPKLLSEWDFDANIDVYTTRAFLHYCEDVGFIANAEQIWSDLVAQKPSVNPRLDSTHRRRIP